jgi:hypothetical protein
VTPIAYLADFPPLQCRLRRSGRWFWRRQTTALRPIVPLMREVMAGRRYYLNFPAGRSVECRTSSQASLIQITAACLAKLFKMYSNSPSWR